MIDRGEVERRICLMNTDFDGTGKGFPAIRPLNAFTGPPIARTARTDCEVHVGPEQVARPSGLRAFSPDLVAWAQRAALDLMPFGLLVVDASGFVLLTNRVADTMVSEADGMVICRGRLTSARPEEARSLAAHIARAVAAPARRNGGAAGMALRVPRPSGRPPYAVLVKPLGVHDLRGIQQREPAALVLVTDLEQRPAACGRYLAELFGLTPAEACLAAALAGGVSLGDYANGAGIALETARWRLKKVLVKTDTHRQSELLALVLSTPAALGP